MYQHRTYREIYKYFLLFIILFSNKNLAVKKDDCTLRFWANKQQNEHIPHPEA